MTKQELLNIKLPEYREDVRTEAKREWDSIAKPLDGLGDFEAMVCDIAAMQGFVCPNVENRVLLVYCADNGVVKEGVSQSTQKITAQVATSLGRGVSSASILAESVKVKVIPVDIGINSDDEIFGVLNRKVAKGTKSFIEAPAMNEEETIQAISTGIELVKELANERTGLIATGEMGIGNTTTATAVLCALLCLDSDTVTGRGAGLDDLGLNRKRMVIRDGIARYQKQFDLTSTEAERAFEILRCLGGLDIAAMCGTFIGGALYGIPIVIDGVISSCAAILAEKLLPGCSRYMLASHAGRESGNNIALEALGKKPYINGNMALGEGTGALMLIPLIDSALHFYKEGTRFSACGIDNYERFN